MARYRPGRAEARKEARQQAGHYDGIERRYLEIENTLPSCGCAGNCKHYVTGHYRYGQPIGARRENGTMVYKVYPTSQTRRIDMTSCLSRPRIIGPKSPTGLPK